MKKDLQLFGSILFISGIILFGIMHLAIALSIPNLGGWSDPPGKFVMVLNEIMGWVPYVLSITLMLIGGYILINNLWETKQIEKNKKIS
jgi:hypothetical protein